jgi:hypothetical protein
VEGWVGGVVSILCFNSKGMAEDSAFTVAAFSSTNGENIAFAGGNLPETGSYTPSPILSYNPGGTINISHGAVGEYSITFNGLNGGSGGVPAGTVQATAYGSDNTSCWTGSWLGVGANFVASVYCDDPNGNPIDSNFLIAVIPGGATPFGIGFAQANNSSAGSYTPASSTSYNSSGGSITATRSTVGQYSLTFSGLNQALVNGGNVLVTAYEFRCNVAAWNASGFVVDVNCYDYTGSPVDTAYQVLVLAPVVGPPAAVAVSGGSPQSALEDTQFGTLLSAQVTNSNGNAVSGVTATFTAPPGSGASGTFPGSFLTATAVTNSSGVATAPTFTANGIAGSYQVSASVLGATSAYFSLTNTAPAAVSITLQTSPAKGPVSFDGAAFAPAPVTVSLVPGSSHTTATETPVSGATGVQYVWQSWSDSGTLSHSITVPSTTTTYTATFQTQYQLTIAASPTAGGTVTPSSGNYYPSGTMVPITATANTGYTFSSWTGTVADVNIASTMVDMSAPETVTAKFSTSTTGITIQTSPTPLQFSVDGGSAQTAPQTLNLSQGTHTISLTTTQAASAAGTQYSFTQWSDNNTTNPRTITVGSSPATYTADFVIQYELTISASPAAGGTVSRLNGTYYSTGVTLPIDATANSGYTFSGWSDNVANPSSATTTVTMNAPEAVTANFSPTSGITIHTSPTGLQFSVDGGAAQTAPKTLNLSQGTHTIAVVTTQAGTPAGTQDVFSVWSDGGAASHSITVTSSAATYTATFTTQYLLTTFVSPAGAGSVTASPTAAGYYNAGTSVQLTAAANAGYQFNNWSDGLSGSTNPQSIPMNAPETVTANFSTGPSSCSFALTPGSVSLPATGTSTVETCPNNSGQPSCGVTPETPVTFTVTPSASCGAWTATSSNPGLLQITSGASGGGAGTVGFALLTNTHNAQQGYTITVESAAGSATYYVTEAGNADSETYRQTYALYEQILGRDPDPNGFQFWSGSGAAGLVQMADSFLTSPEAFNSDFGVMAAYQAATGAPPTYAQFAAAITPVREGTQTVPGLFNSLIGGGFTATALYQNLLNRAPAAADSACIGTGLVACFQTIIGLPSSTTPVGAANNEFQSTGIYNTTIAADHTNALYIQMIYFVILNRDTDPSGYPFWLSVADGTDGSGGGPGLLFQGNAGYPVRIQIMGPGTPNQGLIGSIEFQGLFAN